MSVIRRNDTGNWLIDFSDRFGRVRKTVSSKTYSKRQAEALERRLRREREEGAREISGGSGYVWRDLAVRYWTEHGQHLSWAVTLDGHLAELTGAIGQQTPLDQITPDLIAGIFGEWRGTVADSTLNRRIRVLSGAWNRAIKVWGWNLRAIHWSGLMFPEPETIERNLSADEVDRLIENAPPHLALAIRFAVLTGLRLGAILGLTWGMVDRRRKVIVTKSKGRAGGKMVVIPITPGVDLLLDEIGRQEVGPIITYRDLPVRDVQTAWERTRARAGLPGIRFHDLRHTFAQTLFDASGNLSLVQDALHHTNPSTTRRYARRSPDQIRLALTAIEKGTK